MNDREEEGVYRTIDGNVVEAATAKWMPGVPDNWLNLSAEGRSLMITEKVLLCGNTLMKCCCGATLYFLRQRARSKASNFILCLELF